MKLLRGFKPFPELSRGVAAAIGNFDGVHSGHQALIKTLQSVALKQHLCPLLVLFEPQPGEYFQGKDAPVRLSSLRDKLSVFRQLGVGYVYCIKFNKDISLMPAQTFAQRLLFDMLHVKYLLVGQDFRFGKQREGDVALLKRLSDKHHAEIDTFPDFTLKEERVSSTKIRQALHADDLKGSEALLGRPFSLCGRVVYGDSRGRQWGIPTANIHLNRKTLPLSGVYCVSVLRANGTYLQGVANIGCRPTIDGTKTTLEVHMLHFSGSLYGERLEVTFLKKIRNEIKFNAIDALIAKIHEDIDIARQYFAANNDIACNEH